MDKEFDVLLWGATGFTGRLTAQHLADRYGVDGEELRWTIGGRNLEKLEAVRTALNAADGQLTPVVADANDLDAMRDAASRARVVCSAVGPYARYGSSLVQACAENGADYCDLTGEVQWMRAMMDAHGEAAEASGARIV
ncbi:MAG: saccharopine dehydrogenase NADP-binding domain-containing protein, partial [Gammaproteobacteria bacterium]|nr:saccharopine dehydrogenase NADP-binding domain-containing protein [Gammaproteobacteria bacterium]